MRAGVIAAAVIGLALIGFATSAYTVDEREQVIITQFGRPVGSPIHTPGLHFKLPLIQKVNRFDKRWLDWDGEVGEMRTSEKTPILVDSYARWRIADPLRFFLRLRNERVAQSRLDDIIDSETRNVLASYPIAEIVRSTSRELPPPEHAADTTDITVPIPEDTSQGAPPEDAGESADGAAGAPASAPAKGKEPREAQEVIHHGRDALTRVILAQVQKLVSEFGIEVVDLRFQRVNYTPAVEAKVFERMISERKRIAALYRSEGQGEALRIEGNMTEELKTIESEAYRQVQEIEGQADAKATAIYANAHNRDPELYRMLKSLESYQKAVDEDTWMVLSTESEFYRGLKEMR